jgi:hypothetical protein
MLRPGVRIGALTLLNPGFRDRLFDDFVEIADDGMMVPYGLAVPWV